MKKKNLVMAVNQNNTPGIETICKLIYIYTFLKKELIVYMYLVNPTSGLLSMLHITDWLSY